MSRFTRPVATVFALALTAGFASADSFPSDRGYDDLRSYETASAGEVAKQKKPAATRDLRKDQSKSAFKGFNKKFGSPDRNFESGRR